MKQRLLFVLCVVLGSAGFTAAQTKTVTNFDLEKYKQKRLQAEKELDEYYARRGITKEDLRRQEEEDNRIREELSARLTAERLERERLELEQQALAAEQRQQQQPDVYYAEPRLNGGYFYGFPSYNYGGNHWRHKYGKHSYSGYPSWLQKPRERPQPLINTGIRNSRPNRWLLQPPR